ncbi:MULTISPECIES: hypothetical protein [unclassified Rhizobium]|uniref:hypothetical protein n=1 Tax=unclassified Rhizobium TaxID=2613769 RepID=UPI001AD977A2|nr:MULTISPECIES: hypothetical protein [unclassified Rhizobium]MBO9126589.1 hypothetical protein [Rhizobium sp. 16-488-2b]MBO9176993.1 hypothetical protein [Rhizobium sp. 16-488-2a]
MADPTKSPAVQSFNAEKARQRSAGSDALEHGLEDTFPASDPVSATQSSVASTIDGKAANDRDDAPLVDEALRSTGELGGIEHRRGVRSLRRDAVRLSDQASEVASGAVAVGKAEARSILQGVEDIVKERPLTSVAIVAAVAWF